MTDFMDPDDDYPELVEVLRRLKPAHDVLSPEDTFYAAGWNAAQRKTRSSASDPNRRRGARLFVSGLACGLICAAGGILSLQALTTSEPQLVSETESENAADVDVGVEMSSRATDSDLTEADTANTNSQDTGLGAVLALLRPSHWIPADVRPSAVLSNEVRPFDIDLMARPHVGMRSLTQTFPRTPARSTPDAGPVNQELPLSAGPFSVEMIDDLL